MKWGDIMEKKNMIIAMILSFIWSGLGLIYAEDMKKGIAFALLAIVFYILMYYVHQIFGLSVFIVGSNFSFFLWT